MPAITKSLRLKQRIVACQAKLSVGESRTLQGMCCTASGDRIVGPAQSCAATCVLVLLTAIPDTSLAENERGQEGNGLRVGASVGLAFAEVRDTLLTQPKNSGVGPSFRLKFGHQDRRHIHDFTLAGLFATTSNRYEQGALVVDTRVNYAYVYRLFSFAESSDVAAFEPEFEWQIGASIRGNYKVLYSEDIDERHFYWTTHYDFGPIGRLLWHCASDRGPQVCKVGVAAHLPMVALTSRPIDPRLYNNDLQSPGYVLEAMHRALEFGTWGDFFGAELAVFYELNFLSTDRSVQRLEYVFSYTNIGTSGDSQWLTHQIRLTVVGVL